MGKQVGKALMPMLVISHLIKLFADVSLLKPICSPMNIIPSNINRAESLHKMPWMDMRGYTLLEMLIVLVLLGLLAGLALPRMQRLYESGQIAYEKEDILRQITSLGYVAFDEGRALTLSRYPSGQQDDMPLELPEGWSIHAEPPIHYRPNGVCSGGGLTLVYANRVYEFRLAPPLCKAELL